MTGACLRLCFRESLSLAQSFSVSAVSLWFIPRQFWLAGIYARPSPSGAAAGCPSATGSRPVHQSQAMNATIGIHPTALVNTPPTAMSNGVSRINGSPAMAFPEAWAMLGTQTLPERELEPTENDAQQRREHGHQQDAEIRVSRIVVAVGDGRGMPEAPDHDR